MSDTALSWTFENLMPGWFSWLSLSSSNHRLSLILMPPLPPLEQQCFLCFQSLKLISYNLTFKNNPCENWSLGNQGSVVAHYVVCRRPHLQMSSPSLQPWPDPLISGFRRNTIPDFLPSHSIKVNHEQPHRQDYFWPWALLLFRGGWLWLKYLYTVGFNCTQVTEEHM